MESRTYSRRHHHHSQPPSPDLIRSRSGSSAVSVSRSSTTSPSSCVSQRLSHRSKSTTETRPPTKTSKRTVPNSSSSNSSPMMIKAYGFIPTPPAAEKAATNNKASSEGRFGGLFAAARLRGASAWALSPGRSSSSVVVKTVAVAETKKSGGVGGVFRYFRQKKVSPVEEEEFHSLRVLCNRLIQWRFVNAKAQLAISITNTSAQDKLLSVWLRIYVMRNSLLEKRLQVQKLKLEIKLFMILNPQISLLNEWAKLDKRNQESMAVLVTTLSTLSNRLPLIHGAKRNIISVYEAMTEAMVAMDDIVEIISRFFTQLERILYMVTELLITNKQQLENLEDLEKSVTCVATLVEKETTLRTHCIQAALVLVRTQSY